MDRTAYKNQYARQNYDRMSLTVPKGAKAKVQETAAALGMSVNEYIYALVCDDVAAGASKLGERKAGFNAEQKRMLEKWQVAKKYYEMIQDMSYSKESGYFIYLKAGYINTKTGSRSIYCEKTSEVRRIIVYTEKAKATAI